MTVNSLIMETLRPTGVPVSFSIYNRTEDTYIVFMEYNQAPMLSADDEELWTEHFFQVDIFSKGNYLPLADDVRHRMRDAGFGRMFESETYDEDMERFRKIMRFSYISKGGQTNGT